MSWELVAGAVGMVLALVFGFVARKDRREGNEARALLGESYEEIEQLQNENDRLRQPIETPSERQQSALDELARRRLRDGTETAS